MLVERDKAKYNNLVSIANIHARQYYFLGRSDISDAAYDKLIGEIQRYENNMEFSSENSPTNRVGWYESIALGDGKEFTHKYQKCYSLANIRTSEELKLFLSKDSEIVCMPKLDGCSVFLYYNNGNLTNVVTRGDGKVGVDVTHLQTFIQNTPTRIDDTRPLRLEGEVLCNNFSLDKGKNQRNYVAGSLGLKKAEDAKDRGLFFTVYNAVYDDEDSMFSKFTDILEALRGVTGIKVIDYTTTMTLDTDLLRDAYSSYKYTDGLVFKLNNTDKWNDFTSHHPNFAVAYKFPEIEYQTKLLGVQWQTGKNGQVTPVAILDPVDIDGVTIQRASLANKLNIKARGIKLFDIVNVIRAGSVIPQVVSVYEQADNRQEIECKLCPSCTTELEDRNGILFCVNKTCGNMLQKRMQHFVQTIGIKELGPATIAKLMKSSVLDEFTDIYSLTLSKLTVESGISTIVANKILHNIEISRSVDRCTMWAALGIPSLGRVFAESIFSRFSSLRTVTVDELVDIPGIGEQIAHNIVKWVANNSSLLIELESIFANKTYVATKGVILLTGTMPETRTIIAARLEKKGWKVSRAITKKVDVVLYGKNPGAKLDKAREYGIKIIDYFSEESTYV